MCNRKLSKTVTHSSKWTYIEHTHSIWPISVIKIFGNIVWRLSLKNIDSEVPSGNPIECYREVHIRWLWLRLEIDTLSPTPRSLVATSSIYSCTVFYHKNWVGKVNCSLSCKSSWHKRKTFQSLLWKTRKHSLKHRKNIVEIAQTKFTHNNLEEK